MELLWTEGDGNGFAGHFAGPLIAGARGTEGGTVQDRALANVAGARQAGTKTLVLELQVWEEIGFVVHWLDFRVDVKQ